MDPYQEWTPKGAKMAPEKPRNDPQILTTPKIFDFYHQTLTLKFLYRGSTIYLIRTFLKRDKKCESLRKSVNEENCFMVNLLSLK